MGDAWSLLIVRDLMFYGRNSFKAFREGGEKIATNILTDRLLRLEEAGIIRKKRDSQDARRVAYFLTEKGIELAPTLVEMILWAARHEKTAASPATIREMTQNKAKFLADLRRRWKAAQ